MAKFSGRTAAKTPPATMRHAVTATSALFTTEAAHPTYEGGDGVRVDKRTELLTAVISGMIAEDTFYEPGNARLERVVSLTGELTPFDPEFVERLVPYVRNVAQMRTAPLVIAAEYARAGGPRSRQVIAAACQRPDEPGELLGYWLARHGRTIPSRVKRGLGDAAKRLYTQHAALKYDTASRSIRFGDVLELCHPDPTDAAQSDLFRHLIDRRHARPWVRDTELPTLRRAYELDAVDPDRRREVLRSSVGMLGPKALGDMGYTWERLAGWLPGGMDAEAWEAVIPSMGYMAVLRNLRNFEQAKVSDAVLRSVEARLRDPDEVARSRQFPYRFLSAYNAVQAEGSVRWAEALEAALDLSCRNVPDLDGPSLVLADVSGSMSNMVGSNQRGRRLSPSTPRMKEVGALFASALAVKGSGVDLVAYATHSARVPVALSVLGTIKRIRETRGLDHGTNTWPAVREHFRPGHHRRVLIFTDMQDHPGGADASRIPGLADVPVYVWDLGGYGVANIDTGTGKHMLAGFTDAMFRLLPMLEAGQSTGWDDLLR